MTTPEKPRKVQYNRPLNKGKAVEVSQPFRFDIINQLANIPARITLYELLKLFKSTREALREALTDAEVFATQLPIGSSIDEPQPERLLCSDRYCLHPRRHACSGQTCPSLILHGVHRLHRDHAH